MTNASASAKKIESGEYPRAKTLGVHKNVVEMLTLQIAALNQSLAAFVQASTTPTTGIVGKRFYARVSGTSVPVEVIEDTRSEPRPYRLRRLDNGRVLKRLRGSAALHENPGPWERPTAKTKVK